VDVIRHHLEFVDPYALIPPVHFRESVVNDYSGLVQFHYAVVYVAEHSDAILSDHRDEVGTTARVVMTPETMRLAIRQGQLT
jgi:hypothetical protein